MYSDVFCRVYDAFGWNYYPEAFAEQLLQWLSHHKVAVRNSLDLACGTGVLCRILYENGIEASGMDLSPGMIGIARERQPHIHFDVADMITYRPDRQFDLVTCTGDALNHIGALTDVETIFRNVYACLNPGGYFIFDILDANEVSTSEPFEMDFSETIRVWFQMTQPEEGKVNLKIRVFENNLLSFEENIRETVHDPESVCDLLRKCGFAVIRRSHRLLEENTNSGTTWFVIAGK